MKMKMKMKKVGDYDGYLVMKVIIVKEVMTCDVSPVAMFDFMFHNRVVLEMCMHLKSFLPLHLA